MTTDHVAYLERRVEDLEEERRMVQQWARSALDALAAARYGRVRTLLEDVRDLLEDE